MTVIYQIHTMAIIECVTAKLVSNLGRIEITVALHNLNNNKYSQLQVLRFFFKLRT